MHRFGQQREVCRCRLPFLCPSTLNLRQADWLSDTLSCLSSQVYVYRFLVKNSIEIKMKKLQAKKTRVIKNSLRQEDEQGGTFEDFDAIFASDDDESYY